MSWLWFKPIKTPLSAPSGEKIGLIAVKTRHFLVEKIQISKASSLRFPDSPRGMTYKGVFVLSNSIIIHVEKQIRFFTWWILIGFMIGLMFFYWVREHVANRECRTNSHHGKPTSLKIKIFRIPLNLLGLGIIEWICEKYINKIC